MGMPVVTPYPASRTLSLSPSRGRLVPFTAQDGAHLDAALREASRCVVVRGVEPKVGTVALTGDHFVGRAYRAEAVPGEHAEEALERKLPAGALRGATVYNTLEPCT